ncbi:restriction endonuclease subunit S [Aeromonas rivipollensis]|uniref:restriction endonuclease subunit S n=1 Tax=Aeromonas rivipollensis TaxID=948519 RepID=UPI001F44378F|nr:restriction endonuclease subunit S [Aeromonas rivipollensis]MCE9946147.1 restriction endonuclease subunit S [Aeromonas rivipollensis]
MAEQMMQETAGKTIPAGYKQTEVGVIPKDWVVSSIGEVGELTSSKRIFESDYVTDGIPFYRGQEISALIEGKEIKNVCFISKSRFHQLAVRYGAPQRGDILITAVGTLGNSFLVNVDEPFYFKDGNLIWLRNISGVFPGYLIRQLHFHKNEIVDNAIGSSQKALTIVVLKDFKFPLPINKQEQTAIANVLSDSDALIDALEQLIAKKQAIKSATMQQLLTGRTRLPAFALHPDGTPKGYKPSELGDIPEDWEVDFLGNISDIIRNGSNYKTVSKDGVAVTRIETIADGFIDLNRTGFASIESINGSYKVLRGDILYSHINSIDHIGKVAIFDGGSLLFHGINLVLIRSSSVIDPFWLFNFLSGEVARKWAKQVAKQAVSQASINTKELKSLLLAVPSIQEQTAIATILSDMDNELQALTQKLEKARALKQGMMQQLLTGKIRLPLAAGA